MKLIFDDDDNQFSNSSSTQISFIQFYNKNSK